MRASSNRLVTGHNGPYGQAPAARPADGSPLAALRASDAERDHAIGELRDRFAEGRLSQDTFLYRMDAALRAKEQSELTNLFTDLPGVAPKRGFGQRVRQRLTRLRQRLNRPPYRPMPGPAGQILHSPVPPAPAPSGWQVMPVASTAANTEPKPLCLPRHEDRKFTIGRAPTCDFTVADLSVSRWHARLHKEEESWLLSDLGSTNGTRLNGWRVTQAVQVQAGDEVSFGTVTFVITDRPVIKERAEPAI
jgi:pSer/pThr/pTyr-binding forkhead associated (FHA) protein